MGDRTVPAAVADNNDDGEVVKNIGCCYQGRQMQWGSMANDTMVEDSVVQMNHVEENIVDDGSGFQAALMTDENELDNWWIMELGWNVEDKPPPMKKGKLMSML